MKKQTTALLISTYNWTAALKLVLESVLKQTQMPDEVLIADDGSREDTRILIENYQEKFPVPLIHIWHEDNGFRLAKIRNRAIAKASADYIIQIDGDIILEKHFVEDHKNFAEKGFFVVGSRSLLNENFSKRLLENQIFPTNLILNKNSNNFFNSKRIPFLTPFFRKYKTSGKNKYYAKGCNMAYWKKDVFAVNGYNEDITGWGAEDEELLVRLMKAGTRKKFLKFRAICYHIWHTFAARDKKEENYKIAKEAEKQDVFFINKGISQYL